MESLLDNLVPDEDLDKAIQDSTDLIALHALIQIKQKRLEDHRGNKVKFPISHVIFKEENAELIGSVLKQALLIVEDCDQQIEEALELVTSLNGKEDLKTFQVLTVLLEFAPTIVKTKAALIRPVILSVLNGSQLKLQDFVMVHLLPKYLEVDKNPEFANQIFNIIKATNHLEMLCYLYKHLVNQELLELDEYWVFLHETLSVKDLEKQSSFLLLKSIEMVFSLKCFQSQYVELNSSVVEAEKAWKDFFILLDISKEKQLHLVEPSLRLLDSIKCLHNLWQIHLYRVLLCHTQTAVVYFVALHLVKNHQLEKDHFPFNALLVALNRNEYSAMSDEVFATVAELCKNTGQSELVLLESFNVVWNPVAAWCLYSNIFSKDADFKIPLGLCEKIIHRLELLPNVFIRESCIRVVCEHFALHFNSGSIVELLKMAFMLKNFTHDLLGSFISKHQFCKVELESFIKETFHERNPNIEFLRMLYEVFNHFNLPVFSDIVNDVELPKELRFMIWPELVEKSDLVDYITRCIDSNDAPDIMNYIKLNKLFFDDFFENWSGLSSCKAFKVLLEFKDKRLSSHDIQALSIVSEIFRNNFDKEAHKIVVFNWKDRFSNISGKIEEPIVTLFLMSFFRTHRGLLSETDTIEKTDDFMKETILILNNVLDLNYSSTLPIIFENFKIFWYCNKYEHLIRPFVDRCFQELKKLTKSNLFLRYATIFFDNISQFLWKLTDEFNNYIYNIFHEAVHSLAKDKSEMALILVSYISRILVVNLSQECVSESIVKLLLQTGTIFRRNERVEHGIYYDISQRLPRADPSNPIWIDSATKLMALDWMLHIARLLPNAADAFISTLLEKYMQYFNKRYFPDSQVHIEKLRIIQAMLLIHPYIKTSKEKMINFIADSFLSESHQPSVRHLMQWLMIHLLMSQDEISAVEFISNKLNKANNTRPTSVTAFIPVLYHLSLHHEETYSNIVVKTLLPYTMGAQFKLRAFSQAAIKKLYERAREKKFEMFVNTYTVLYNSVNSLIESSADPFFDLFNLENDFLEYFELNARDKGTDFLNIYYFIPKRCNVTPTEWQHLSDEYRKFFINVTNSRGWRHLSDAYRNNFVERCDKIRFYDDRCFYPLLPPRIIRKMYSESNTRPYTLTTNDNVQRKITPWKSALEDEKCSSYETDFILITSLLEKNTNLGGLVRTCEVFGVKQVVMKTAKVVADKEFKSLSMSSENWVDIVEVKMEDVRAFILDIKTKGYRVVGAEQTTNSVQLDQFKFPQKTVLLLGNEKEGIPPDLIAVIDNFVEIPQFGMVRSLNVHVAGAIVIWEYRKQHPV